MAFTHLHLHTEYSLLDGACRIEKLLDKAKEMGQTSVAITDHGVMYGVIDFYKAAKARGIKPIIGCEIYIAARAQRRAHFAFGLPCGREPARASGRRLRRGQGGRRAVSRYFRPGQLLSRAAEPRPAGSGLCQPAAHPAFARDGHPARRHERLPLHRKRRHEDAPHPDLHPDEPHDRG